MTDGLAEFGRKCGVGLLGFFGVLGKGGRLLGVSLMFQKKGVFGRKRLKK